MNALTPDMHRESDFDELFTAIEQRMKEMPASPKPETSVHEFEREDFEPETILIPGGSFWMGSDPGEGVKDYDTPRHKVSLPTYRISKYPVLNREYAEFITQSGTQVSVPLMGFSGLNPKDGLEDQPVQGVTLEDVRAYCKWLSELTKRNYDLPNEAQLEKACQGPYGLSDILEDIYLWTCTLWGEDLSPPDSKYRYPWKNDARNKPNANSQIRRVVCRYKKGDGADQSRRYSRLGQFPQKPLPPERYSFRVVMNV
jgi:formylglycine-generating enzyme required for sulfatase activity